VSGQFSLLTDPTLEQQVADPRPGRTRRRGVATSRVAANATAIRTGTIRFKVLIALREAGAHGANDFELWSKWRCGGKYPHVTGTRRGELEILGLVRATAITRPTDSPTREGLVHVITDTGLAVLDRLQGQETP